MSAPPPPDNKLPSQPNFPGSPKINVQIGATTTTDIAVKTAEAPPPQEPGGTTTTAVVAPAPVAATTAAGAAAPLPKDPPTTAAAAAAAPPLPKDPPVAADAAESLVPPPARGLHILKDADGNVKKFGSALSLLARKFIDMLQVLLSGGSSAAACRDWNLAPH